MQLLRLRPLPLRRLPRLNLAGDLRVFLSSLTVGEGVTIEMGIQTIG